MEDERQAKYEAFKKARDWIDDCTEAELKSKLESRIANLADSEHVCHTCGKTFDEKYALAGHRQKHIAEEADPVTCSTCGETFENEWALVGHQQKHLHEDETIECGICGEDFRDEGQFNVHKQHHLTERDDPVFCEQCGQKVKNQRILKAHKSKAHSTCSTPTPDSNRSVREDILHELRKKTYRPVAKIAEEYGVPPEYVQYLNQGKRYEGGYYCLLCGDTFNSENGVEVHLRRSHDKSGKRKAERYAIDLRDQDSGRKIPGDTRSWPQEVYHRD